ncbi:bifunctional 4-hydroxy-2-oxoglutarate aldolase/2-dehydro-3-deoxy-phosphogluconate aldolase [Roseivirga sp. BDSF3-8]|uniref:bifunctional 4-hydroxy-2-oxoglutarate aldolase/2-dehydro-3-deoxy-phosphogluconate aldolase n=1 Tax=Roseivirga sp. BDSF3-8 TaxID=3241598 RepID=UPI0035324782
MTYISRISVAQEMERTGLVPLFYHADTAVVIEVVKALYRGGARLFEFTHRGAHAADVFKELAQMATEELPGMYLGAGSVTDAATASAYMNMGASFIVTPVLREDIALTCNRRKVLYAPGCGSLTEIARAEELGCDIVKLFPASVYGPEFIKAVAGPQPWTRIMPTGGVTTDPDDLKQWLAAGAVCVGLGSQLITKDLLQSKDYDLLARKTSEVLSVISNVRQS